MTMNAVKNVCNRLLEVGLSARRPYVGCVLVQRHRVNRLNWARKFHVHQRWLRQRWNSVLFSVESRLTIHRGDGRVRQYPRRNEPTVAYEIVLMVARPRAYKTVFMLNSAEHEISKLDESDFNKPSGVTLDLWRFSLFLPIEPKF